MVAMDHSQTVNFTSILGHKLEISRTQDCINPADMKRHIQNEIDFNQVRIQYILEGQQDPKDLFMILDENKSSGTDIKNFIFHTTIQTITCYNCMNKSIKENDDEQLFFENECPDDGVSLKSFLESTVNSGRMIEYRCEMCKVTGESSKQHQVITQKSSKFLIVSLQRDERSYPNRITATEDITLIDSQNSVRKYSPICIIYHQGGIEERRGTVRHYMCDIKNKMDGCWYKTSDASQPRKLKTEEVSKNGNLILFKRIS